jgi:predicted tellurium resistance membrane protein TerC
MNLLDRFPILVWAGAALLGWIVGETIATDPVTASYLAHSYGPTTVQTVTYAAAAAGAMLVLIVGGLWRRSKLGRASDSA